MQGLLEQIVAKTGPDVVRAERAVGIPFNLRTTRGDKATVDLLFATMPGAADLAAKHGGDNAGGRGLMDILADGLMGGPLAMITKLPAMGLSTDQINQVSQLTLDHIKSKAGAKAVRDAASNISGIGSYL